MRKTSVLGSSVTGSGAYLEAIASLTAAMQELQAAMSALVGVIQTSPAAAPGASGEPDYAALQPPQDIYSLEEQTMPRSERERQRIARSMGQRDAAGDFSPNEELDVAEEIKRLAADEVRAESAISHGLEDYLPALSANRPPSFTRYDSVQLASIWHDAESEKGWPESRLLEHGPHGLTDLDTASTQRLAEAIGRLTEAILHGGGRSGSALHPGEAQGGLNGLLQSARLPARPDGYN